LDYATWTLGLIGTLISDDTIPEGITGNNAQHAILFALTGPFIVRKKEETIFNERTADRCSENISDQLERRVGFTRGKLRLLDEIVVGAGDRIAVIFVQ